MAVWLCCVLLLATSHISAVPASEDGKPISHEVAAELTAFGSSLFQFLRFWTDDLSASAAGNPDGLVDVSLNAFDEHSVLPEVVQDCVTSTNPQNGLKWGFAKPTVSADPASERIAVLAGELAKTAANYQYGLDAHRHVLRSQSETDSLVCLPGEECRFTLDGGDKSPTRWGIFERKATLPLKSGLRTCIPREDPLAASCLNHETDLLELATFWYRAVIHETDVASDRNETPAYKSLRDSLLDADSKRRELSFRRALLPYSQWVNTEEVIDGLTAIDLYACQELSREDPKDNGQPLRAKSDAEWVELPSEQDCFKIEEFRIGEKSDRDLLRNCSLRRDFLNELRSAHLSRFFAQQLRQAQRIASMQSTGDRSRVLQLAGAIARLTPQASAWLGLDNKKREHYIDINSQLEDFLQNDNQFETELKKTLAARNQGFYEGESPCKPVFEYDPNPNKQGKKPSDPQYANCKAWLEESTGRLAGEFRFLSTALPLQKKQYQAARDLLTGVGPANSEEEDWVIAVAKRLYQNTRGAETADTLIQRLGGPTECAAQAEKLPPCKALLDLPQSKAFSMKPAIRVYPAQDYDDTYNVSTQAPVTVRKVPAGAEGCNLQSPCYVAESRTPAVVSFTRSATHSTHSSLAVTPFEYADWGLKVIDVRARQVGSASCPLAEVLRKPGNGEQVCAAARQPMTLDNMEKWRWVRPDQQKVRDWLAYNGMNGLVVADGVGVFRENNEIRMTGSFAATALGSSEFVPFKLSLTHQSESDWRRILRTRSLEAVLKALPGLSRTYAQADSVPSFINLPDGMVFVALTLDSADPIRFRLYAYPKGKPSLITAFTGSFSAADVFSWSAPRALLAADVLLHARKVDFGAIAELATVFSSQSGLDNPSLGEAMARRDMFEATLTRIGAEVIKDVVIEDINVRSTTQIYQEFGQRLTSNVTAEILDDWKEHRELYRDTLKQARIALEQTIVNAVRAKKISPAWPNAPIQRELLHLLGFANVKAANDYINELLPRLVTEAIRSFSVGGGLFQCWSSLKDLDQSFRVDQMGACAVPLAEMNSISTQVTQRFALGSHLPTNQYNEKIEAFRERLNKPPSPLTTQQVLDAAHQLRVSVADGVEQLVQEAWGKMLASIRSPAGGGPLGALVGAMKDPERSAGLYQKLQQLNSRCGPEHRGCSDVLISLAMGSLYSGEVGSLGYGLEQHLEQRLKALIPRPEIVYGSVKGKLSDAERQLSNVLADAGETLSDELKEGVDEVLSAAVTTAGLKVREANAFIPAAEPRDGALYIRFDSKRWGARKGDRILGVNCQADGTACNTKLTTVEELRAALSGEQTSAASPSPFVRVQRGDRQMTLVLPRTASYQLAVLPAIPGLDTAMVANVQQLAVTVDPRNGVSVKNAIDQAELKRAVLKTTLDALNDRVPLDWKKEHAETLAAFTEACKKNTGTGFFGIADIACDDPMALFRKASGLDLQQVSSKAGRQITQGAANLSRPDCTPDGELHPLLQQAGTAACGKLNAHLDDVESALTRKDTKSARALLASLPQTVTQAFGETFAEGAKEAVLAKATNIASAAELLRLQQTVFEFEVQANRVCADALESVGGPSVAGCDGIVALYKKALNLDIRKIAEDVKNSIAESAKLPIPSCQPNKAAAGFLQTAANAACGKLRDQMGQIQVAVQTSSLQRAENLAVAMPRAVVETFAASLKRQTEDSIQQATNEVRDQVMARLQPFQDAIKEYEIEANRLCVVGRDRIADLVGDQLPVVDGCKGIGAVLDPKLLEKLAKRRIQQTAKAAEEVVRDEIERELEAHAKPILKAAETAVEEQRKLLEQAAKAKATPVLAKLREAESRVCSAVDSLFGGSNSLNLIAGSPITLERPDRDDGSCVPRDLNLKAKLNLLGRDISIEGGLSLNTDKLREDTVLDQLESGKFEPAKLVRLNWKKLKTEPTLASVLNEKLQDLDEGLSLQRLVARDDRIQADLLYQPDLFPFAVPVTTEISNDGAKLSLGSFDDILRRTVCGEISDYVLRQQPEIIPDARIIKAPPKYCIDRELKGLELLVAVELDGAIGRVDVPVFLDIETGMRILPPDPKQLATTALLEAFGINAVRPSAPYFDTADGFTLYLEGKVGTPIGLALQAGFSVSPRRFKFRGPVGLRIPGWYDAAIVSLGNMGIAYDPEKKALSLLGSATLAPGAATNNLVRVDGRGTLGIKDQELKLTGNLMVLRLLSLASTTTRFNLPERLLEHRIGTSPMLADIVKLQGHLRIQDLSPNPFLAASGEGGIFGADIAEMDVELQRNFGGHFDAALMIPLDDSSIAFNVKVEENTPDVSAGRQA
ncbi:MAG: hypothetical protein AB2559_19430, partial [Candidatus Thiodiazotropha endolucinida]